ncbi:MAG: acetylxylan esterase [Acidobacteriota bacterium]|nr:acetylxylan esterase [Acidobacteriota bacterium]
MTLKSFSHQRTLSFTVAVVLLMVAAQSAPVVFTVERSVAAQERVGQVQVRVSTNRDDWTYQPGESVKFRIAVVRDGHVLKGVRVRYRVGPELMPPTIEQTATLDAEGITVDAGTMSEPGFLRCVATVEVDGKTYRGLATAGFKPEAISPTTENPADFDAFWSAGKEALAKLPSDAKLTLLPDYSTPTVNVYHVSLQSVGADINIPNNTSRVYGILCEPKADGKYPALLSVPGAGVRPYRGLIDLAEKGIITFQIGIHGIPVTQDPLLYTSLSSAALAGYPTFNLDNRERYYYRRVYLGCVRANDFLTSLPKYDGTHLAVTGGSQGGALTIVTAALDPRVKALAAIYPALSDMTGYLRNRAGGWPHMFRVAGANSHRTKEKIETSHYYDVVNFARRLKVPGLYSWGYNDETCPPTSMYSAYNVINAPKQLLLALETGHNTTPEQQERINRWLETYLKKG